MCTRAVFVPQRSVLDAWSMICFGRCWTSSLYSVSIIAGRVVYALLRLLPHTTGAQRKQHAALFAGSGGQCCELVVVYGG